MAEAIAELGDDGVEELRRIDGLGVGALSRPTTRWVSGSSTKTSRSFP
jgi:hypothetical protein